MSMQIKNLLVGIFILSAIAIFISAIFFLKPTIGDGKQILYIRFSDISGIGVGTRVRFAGRPIGEVASLHEIKDARQQPTDELGRVYFYQLSLKIDSNVKVYNTDEVAIATSGLLGEKSISITPKAPPVGVTPKQIKSQPIYANSVDALQNAVLDFSDLATTMEQTFSQLSSWINDHGNEVAHTIVATGCAMKEMDRAINACNENSTFENVAKVMQNLHLVSNDLADGKGTLGKFIQSEDLYLEMDALLLKANELMNAVNHYGLLFNLNKEWQRTRLKRINEINALSTPKNFRTYFQTEVSDINASMDRISLLIEKAENSNKRAAILSSPEFKRDFAELLRKSNQLSDQLRLYNEQLNQKTGM